ncbi:MAG TPA: trigger factor [Pyrinomonadaceae bacterium]
MKSEVVDISPTRKEIKIEVGQETVREAYDRISERYSKLANVPGFRRGRAPVSVVRTRFKDEIRGEVLREVVPQAIQDAITESGLDVLGDPDIHMDNPEALERLGQQPISLHVHVEVMPEFALGEFKGLEARRMLRPVTDEDVERVIEGLREASASLQPVEDRASEAGDTVTADFTGKFVDEPGAEDINVEDVDVELGGEGVQQEFTENLTGVHPDEEKTFTVRYPEDFTSKGLAGKTVEYTAKVMAVRRKELPEVDDEWAKSLGDEFDTVATLRGKIREDLERRSQAESDERLRGAILRKLVEAHPFEVPQTLIQHQTTHRLESVMRDMMGRGIDPRAQELDWEGVRGQLQSQAEHDVRGSLLLERIAERENVGVGDEEVAAEIEMIAQASRQSPEQVRAALTKQGGERSIADRLRTRKVLDLLVENARVTDEEWREETPEDFGTTAAEETPAAEEVRAEEPGEAQARPSSSEG